MKRNETKEAKKFGVVLGIAAGLAAGWMFYKERTTIAGIAAGLSVVFLVLPFALTPLWLAFFRKWMKLAEAISWVMTRVILGVFFFLMLTPVGLLMRLLGKRPLDLKFKDGKSTNWIDKPEEKFTIERYRKQY
jgi:hypothetical protein